jgi:putative transcriptional regulator
MTTRDPDDVLDDNPEWDATNTRPLDTPSAQLRAARAVLGLTQTAVADLLGVPVATLRNWEQGRTEPDDAGRTLIRLLAANPREVYRLLVELGGSKM